MQLSNPRGAEFEDRSGRLIAWSEAGQPMYIDFSAQSGHGLQCVYICRLGQIVVDELAGDMRVMARKAEFRDLPTTRYGMPADYQQMAIEPVDTVAPTVRVWRALLAGEAWAWPDGVAGRHAQACLVAAHASHDAGGSLMRIDDPSMPAARHFPWA